MQLNIANNKALTSINLQYDDDEVDLIKKNDYTQMKIFEYRGYHVNKQTFWRAIMSLVLSLFGSYIVLTIVLSNDAPSIRHQANAWSSISYAIIDGPPAVRFPLLVLSIASFNLWANSTEIVNFIDVTSIFWVIIAVTISILPQARSAQFMLLVLNVSCILAISIIICISYTNIILHYYSENLVVITGIIYVLCGLNMAAFYITDKTFVLGISCISVGFVFKLLTIFGGQYWGTCLFHLLSALGTGILLQLSTLDKNVNFMAKLPNCI